MNKTNEEINNIFELISENSKLFDVQTIETQNNTHVSLPVTDTEKDSEDNVPSGIRYMGSFFKP